MFYWSTAGQSQMISKLSFINKSRLLLVMLTNKLCTQHLSDVDLSGQLKYFQAVSGEFPVWGLSNYPNYL